MRLNCFPQWILFVIACGGVAAAGAYFVEQSSASEVADAVVNASDAADEALNTVDPNANSDVQEELDSAGNDPKSSEALPPNGSNSPEGDSEGDSALNEGPNGSPNTSDENESRNPNTTVGVLPGDEEDFADEEDGPVAPSDILAEYEITQNRYAQLSDGTPMLEPESDRELLFRLLFRLPNISEYSFEYWAQEDVSVDTIADNPDPYRGQPFALRGRLVMLEKLTLGKREAERFEFGQLFRCHVLAGDPEKPVVVFTREVPKSLEIGEPLNENVSFRGLFLKLGGGGLGVPSLVFVAARLQWHSDTLLGDLGMDVGLFDSVVHGRSLHSSERECFYQLLATMKNAGKAELLRHARNDLIYRGRHWVKRLAELTVERKAIAASTGKTPPSKEKQLRLTEIDAEIKNLELQIAELEAHSTHEFVPLIENPRPHVGQLFMYRATAHRIIRIRTDASVAERFGITHYYQIDATVPLDRKIKLVIPSKDGGPGEERITWSHPATFCVLSLPEGLPRGESVNEPIRLAGFLFKNWGYPTGESADGDGVKWRSAPMIIGREPIWDQPPPANISLYAGALAGGLFVLALCGIWIGVWRINRGDANFHEKVISRSIAASDGVSLNQIGLEAMDVDFSYLDDENVSSSEHEGGTADGIQESERGGVPADNDGQAVRPTDSQADISRS